MKVALVTPDLRPTSGGPAVSVPRLAEALSRAGADVELHAIGPAGPDIAGVRLHPAEGAWPARLGRSPALRRGLESSRVDVVHANGLWMLPLHYAHRAARRHEAVLVVSPRGMLAPWALRRSSRLKALAARIVHPGALTGADGWHATSSLEAGEIRAYGLRQPICVAANGVSVPRVAPEVARAHYHEAVPATARSRILLYYSRFHSKKRPVELVEDFAALAPRQPDWHLLLVGIPEEYGVARLEAAASQLGVADRVSVLDGRGRPQPYPVAELLVLPTHSENFGMVVGEALAWGVPVLTTTGTPWRVLDEIGAGACVELSQLRDTLDGLLSLTPDRLRAQGERGRRWALRELDADASARRLLAFYTELRTRRSSAALSTLSSS